jgi:tetratricopeptide (TPR) repeat protein
MYRLLVCILFVLGVGKVSVAQTTYSYQYVDSATYQQWLNKDWKGIISLNKSSQKQNLDFYYLRLRTGIAYYNMGKYRKASQYFNMIFENDSSNVLAIEYLYYCYLFSGQSFAALQLKKSFNEELKQKIGSTNPLIAGFSNQTGGLFQAPKADKALADYQTDALHPLTRSELQKQTFSSTALEFNLGLSTRFTAAYTYLQNEKKAIVKTDELAYLNLATDQNQYYFLIEQYLGRGWSASAATHFLNVEFQGVDYEMDVYNYDETSHRSYDTAVVTGGGFTVNQHIEQYDTTFGLEGVSFDSVFYSATLSNYLINLGLNKSLHNFDLSMDFSFGTINLDDYVSLGLGAIYYPFGNLNTYFSTKAAWHQNTSDNFGTRTSWTTNLKLGQKVFKYLWLESSLKLGNTENVTFNNASLILNSTYTEKNNLSFGVIVPIKKISLYLKYVYSENIEEQTVFSGWDGQNKEYDGVRENKIYRPNGLLVHRVRLPYSVSAEDYSIEQTKENFIFINHTITGGLKWNF